MVLCAATPDSWLACICDDDGLTREMKLQAGAPTPGRRWTHEKWDLGRKYNIWFVWFSFETVKYSIWSVNRMQPPFSLTATFFRQQTSSKSCHGTLKCFARLLFGFHNMLWDFWRWGPLGMCPGFPCGRSYGQGESPDHFRKEKKKSRRQRGLTLNASNSRTMTAWLLVKEIICLCCVL